MANYCEFFRFNGNYCDVFTEEDGHYLYAEAEPWNWPYYLTCKEYTPAAGGGYRVSCYGGADVDYLQTLEAACEDVRNTIETLLRGEWEWFTSYECARDEFEGNHAGEEYRTRDNAGRVYYTDSRKWYTSEGELYGQSDIYHTCVSIVKAGCNVF